MARLIPKLTNDESWEPLVQHRDYAVLCNPEDVIYFRFGQGRGMYMSLDPSGAGRMANSLDYETGEQTLLGKLQPQGKTVLGRTAECSLKVMHAIISRQHLEMEVKGNVLILRDVGSTNGSFLLKETKHFDIENYLSNHPLDKAQESTMDWVHEAFGPTVDEFLKTYSQSKKETN